METEMVLETYHVFCLKCPPSKLKLTLIIIEFLRKEWVLSDVLFFWTPASARSSQTPQARSVTRCRNVRQFDGHLWRVVHSGQLQRTKTCHKANRKENIVWVMGRICKVS